MKARIQRVIAQITERRVDGLLVYDYTGRSIRETTTHVRRLRAERSGVEVRAINIHRADGSVDVMSDND